MIPTIKNNFTSCKLYIKKHGASDITKPVVVFTVGMTIMDLNSE
jgi:hypothetical protein